VHFHVKKMLQQTGKPCNNIFGIAYKNVNRLDKKFPSFMATT